MANSSARANPDNRQSVIAIAELLIVSIPISCSRTLEPAFPHRPRVSSLPVPLDVGPLGRGDFRRLLGGPGRPDRANSGPGPYYRLLFADGKISS